MKEIAFLILGTNNYIELAEKCAKSIMDNVHIPDHKINVVLFSNQTPGKVSYFDQTLYIPHLPWPLITHLRYYFFNQHKGPLSKYDYLYYIDADMEVIKEVGQEILGNRVATKHPGLWGHPGEQLPYERNPGSTAYIPYESGYNQYFFGALQGGTNEEFLKMSRVLSDRINQDLKRNYIALWHDESQMNRYFMENPPDVVLDQSYAYPEKWNLPFVPKILAKDKNHEEIRKEN